MTAEQTQTKLDEVELAFTIAKAWCKAGAEVTLKPKLTTVAVAIVLLIAGSPDLVLIVREFLNDEDFMRGLDEITRASARSEDAQHSIEKPDYPTRYDCTTLEGIEAALSDAVKQIE